MNPTKIDPDGTWLCHHVTLTGEPAPSARLSLAGPVERKSAYSLERLWFVCPDCGTEWGAWPTLGVAKWLSEWRPASEARQYHHVPRLDIDRVIELVCRSLPQMTVCQHEAKWPGDDEGLWIFRVPEVADDIRLESGTGMCPFFVEGDVAINDVPSVADVAGMVVDYLNGKLQALRPKE